MIHLRVYQRELKFAWGSDFTPLIDMQAERE